MRKIGKKEIEEIAVGAAVLGAGGGGDPYIGKLMALQAVDKYGDVTLLNADEVPDDAMFAAVNMIGAPTVLVEKIPSGLEMQSAFRQVAKNLGKPVYGILPFEAGGINSMLPIVVAATNNLPIIDVDGMGRAFPETQMVTWSLFDILCTPAVVCDEKGNSVTVNACDNYWAERLCRTATSAMGGSCYMSCYAMTGAQMKQCSIIGTTTKCEMIGRIIHDSKVSKTDPVSALLDYVKGFILFKGKIVEVDRSTVGGFVRGEARLEGLDEFKDESLKVNFQNENIIAQTETGEILCTAPDLITMLDLEAALPVTTEQLKYGTRLVVTGIPISDLWRSEKGIKVAGPESFGYSGVKYIPVEERVKNFISKNKIKV